MQIEYNKNDYPYVRAKLFRGDRSRWYIEYYIYHTGKAELTKRRFYKITGKTEAEKVANAARAVQEINKLLFDGYILAPEKGQKGSGQYQRGKTTRRAFEDAMRRKAESVGKRSRQNYKNYYNIFSAWLAETNKGGRQISQFNKNDLLDFRSYLFQERGNGNKTRNNYINHLRSLLALMVESGEIQKNPAEGIKKLKEEAPKNIPFLPEERATLENYLQKSNLGLYYFTRFIYYGFIRPVEICRMRINHIDQERGIIIIRSGQAKNARQMPVVITRQLQTEIAKMKLENFPGNYHLFSKDLQPGTTERYRNRISEYHAKALKACGLYNGELSLYSWKHTGNVNAYLAGVDIKSIQSQNRHHSLEMTEIYLRSLGMRFAKDLQNKEW